MNHLIYEPEYKTTEFGHDWRVFAYVTPDRRIVVEWQVYHNPGWERADDHVCEDFAHFIDVWEGRWES